MLMHLSFLLFREGVAHSPCGFYLDICADADKLFAQVGNKHPHDVYLRIAVVSIKRSVDIRVFLFTIIISSI